MEMCVLTKKAALKREWITTEWGAAWALGMTITPILVEGSPSDLPMRLARLQAVPYRRFQHYLEQVVERAKEQT